VDIEKLKKVREKTILAGKASKRFLRIAEERDPEHKRDKFHNPTNIEASGSICMGDTELLAKLITDKKPKVIAEIGTWFGTSAYLMIEIAKEFIENPIVYTCDKHKVYVDFEEYRNNIRYYNRFSTVMLKSMINNDVKIDFAFIDANIVEKDARLLLRMFNRPVSIAVHDWGQKGTRAVEKIMDEAKIKNIKLKLIKPPVFGFDSCMAVLVEE